MTVTSAHYAEILRLAEQLPPCGVTTALVAEWSGVPESEVARIFAKLERGGKLWHKLHAELGTIWFPNMTRAEREAWYEGLPE